MQQVQSEGSAQIQAAEMDVRLLRADRLNVTNGRSQAR